MAVIADRGAQITRIERWLGLNESPDGDTGLRPGEAAVMRNFCITRENHLQIRPGYAAKCTLAADTPVRGLWSGYVGGAQCVLAACGGRVWSLHPETWQATDLGAVDDAPVRFFGFGQKVYLLTGTEYYVWDGTGQVRTVEGYIPTVVTAAPPSGGGALLERVNLLTGKKRAEFSPNGTAKEFALPEQGIDGVIGVEGTDITWTADKVRGTVTFATAPAEGVNSIAITWRKGSGNRAQVTAMRFAETYNGTADSRVFLYGDGSNRAVYSDLDGDGQPTAEYFPDLNLMAVDSANTPVTAMIRHYDNLLVFKEDGAFTTGYDTLTLEGGTVTAAFYTRPLNREIGCAAPGQAVLVRNNPRTLHAKAVWEWALAGSGSRDERNAKRISDRVGNTLAQFAPEACLVFDDEGRQEYYVVCGDRALIHNYGNDTWYFYDHFPALCMADVNGGLYFGTGDGRIMHVSRDYRNDGLEPIDAYWESGSMSFEREWKRKYCTHIWVSVKPESQSRVTVTAQSDRKSDHARKVAACSLSTLGNVHFAHWSFGTNRKPQVQRIRLKVRKFTFCKLIFSSRSASATATVLAADFKTGYGGNVR